MKGEETEAAAKKPSAVKFRMKRYWVGMTETHRQLTTRGETEFAFDKMSLGY